MATMTERRWAAVIGFVMLLGLAAAGALLWNDLGILERVFMVVAIVGFLNIVIEGVRRWRLSERDERAG